MEFVRDGLTKESILKQVKAQSLLGEEDFVERIARYLKGYEDTKEIPKSQRFIGRPSLEKLFAKKSAISKLARDIVIVEAVEKYGYHQKEVAGYVGLHYSTISKLVNENRSKQQD